MAEDHLIVPPELAAFHASRGEAGRAWVAGLPVAAAVYLRRWRLRLDGSPLHGKVGLVLPVVRADGSPAVLKLHPIDAAHPGEAAALRTWNGDAAVRLLDEDPSTGTLLLERLDHRRSLVGEPDVMSAVLIIGELLVRLNSHPPPPEALRLSDVAAAMITDVPAAVRSLPTPDEARLVLRCAAVVDEISADAGNQLLHWDLHYDNVLAGEREPWLAIDPKPLAGDPGFELLPALHDRWADALATGAPERAVLRRFDLLVEVLGLDRDRAIAWTLGRVLQNALWDIADGEPRLDPVQVLIASTIAHR